MRKHLIGTLLVKAAAFVVVFASAAAVSLSAGSKDRLLSKAEVKNLIAKSETKADHERLARYFDAEAARYEAESKDHTEMGQFYQKNPDPALAKQPGTPRAAGIATLCPSLQNAAEESRQLAAEHREKAKEAKR